MNNNIYMRILEVKIFRNMYVTGSKYYTLSIHFYTKSNGNSKY